MPEIRITNSRNPKETRMTKFEYLITSQREVVGLLDSDLFRFPDFGLRNWLHRKSSYV
jgi:hypothetical protein